MTFKVKHHVIDGKKMCGECKEYKPLSEFEKTKNYFSSKCISCLKLYRSNYKQRPKVKERTRQFQNEEKRLWTLKQKQKAIDYKGGECQICGYSKCSSAFDFHHLNPAEKEGPVSCRCFDNIKKELDKCVLVCARCHREIHAGLHPNYIIKEVKGAV